MNLRYLLLPLLLLMAGFAPTGSAVTGNCEDLTQKQLSCGCGSTASEPTERCGQVSVTCDTRGGWTAEATGVLGSANTLWSLRVTNLAYGYDATDLDVGVATFMHQAFTTPIDTDPFAGPLYTITAELRADGDRVAYATVSCI